MDNPELLHKTSFACRYTTAQPKQDAWLSKASIDNLRHIVPSFALDQEFDLLPIAFNAAVVNLGNLNGDLIDTDTAIAVYQKFAHRPINIEHDRANIIGHLIGAAFSSFNIEYRDGFGSNLLSDAEVTGTIDPFNISLSGFIYKVADSELVDLITEASNPLSENYLSISTSWEMAFSDYDILLGSPLISKGQRITDPELKAEYSPYTKAYGGSGKYKDGQEVYRIIKGKVVPLGIGLTTTPAAAVAGIIPVTISRNIEAAAALDSVDTPNVTEVGVLQEVAEEIAAHAIIENQEENIKIEKNISQLETNPVNTISIMRLKDINDENLKSLTIASLKDLVSEEVKATHNQILTDAIDKAADEYGAKLDAEKAASEAKAQEAEKAKLDLEAFRQQLEEVQKQLEAERTARANEQASADFNVRMSDLTEKYNLSDKDREIIAKQIRGLDEQAYSTWLGDWSVIAETKSKTFTNQQAVASTEDALDKLENGNAPVLNIQDLSSTRAKWENAFKLDDLISRK